MALILQVMRWAAGECQMDCIDITSVKGAIQLIEYFEDSYKRVNALSGMDEPNRNQDRWLAMVGDTFTSSEAEQAGQRTGVSRRTVFSSLKRLCETTPPVLQKVKQGVYEKVVKRCTTALCTSALSDSSEDGGEGKVQSAEVQSADSAQEGGEDE